MYIGKAAIVAVLAVVMLVAMGYLTVKLNQASADLDTANTTLERRQTIIDNMAASNAGLRTTLDEANANVEKGNEEIAKGNAKLAAADAEIRKGNALIAEKDAALGMANEQIELGNAEIAKAQANINELTTSNRKWESDYAAQGALLSAAQGQVLTLSTQNNSLQSALSTSRTRTATLEAENRGLEADLRSARNEYRQSVAALATLREERDRLEAEALVDAQALAALESRIAAMEKRILELAGQRAPLILGYGDTSRAWFACTGSMEPVITCMDEATWLHDFDPADIVVGATISFDPNCWEDEASGVGTAHRVMAVEVRDGVHYYWPQGDASDEPDGCWVPEHSVDSYLIKIHKNVNWENRELRKLVNDARATWLEARAAYYELRDQHCERGEYCTLPTTAIYNRVVALAEAMNAARDVYDCWIQVAVDSRYPGHIPPNRC